ncbi:hypothetical protein ANCCAN_26166 [Ancylostoma caninum]|uniref:Uncharacterized protein n=1 Tax=Ancylostoma caninum TaxID=29170 RepID=A0A368FBA1_ANCCA|nr:hypothetical protein ANCCAN_26166 [Ancylostoma caninum]
MLAAHELGMATSGEYVFINIDVSTGSHAEKPWVRANETNQEENEKAKEAYRALKTISLRRFVSTEVTLVLNSFTVSYSIQGM